MEKLIKINPPAQRFCQKCGKLLIFIIEIEPFMFSTLDGSALYRGKQRCPIHKNTGIDWQQHETEGKDKWFVTGFVG